MRQRSREFGVGSGQGLVDRDGCRACRPTGPPSGRGALGSLFGVGMFLKRCDPRGCALSATASVQEGWMMVGMAQRSWSPPEPLGRGGEGEGAVVTLHSGQSCRGTPRLHGSTAGTGPAGTGGMVNTGNASGFPNILPRALTLQPVGHGLSHCWPRADAGPRPLPQAVCRGLERIPEGSSLAPSPTAHIHRLPLSLPVGTAMSDPGQGHHCAQRRAVD